jgi:hypothetical protein
LDVVAEVKMTTWMWSLEEVKMTTWMWSLRGEDDHLDVVA